MIMALKPVVQEVLRLFGLNTGLFFTHERNKCLRGRVAVRRGEGQQGYSQPLHLSADSEVVRC